MNKKIFIVISIIAITLIAVILYLVNRDFNTPEDVLKQYMAYINDGKYEEMYGLLSDKSKKSIDKDTFLARNQNIYEGIEAKNVKVNTIAKEDENTYSYQTTLDTIAGNISFENKITFEKQEDKKYYINWDSTLIFPDLTSEDKIRVDTAEGERGRILDRNGIALAEQGTVYVVGFVPRKNSGQRDGRRKSIKST